MTRAVRILRVVLPIVFVGFIAILALSYTSNVRRDPDPKREPVTSTMRPGDDKAQLVANEFEDVQTIGGRVALKISARRTIAFQSGWFTLEEVKITVYQAGGQSYEISSPQAQVQKETRKAEARGGVKITSNQGVEISTASIHFDGKRVTNERIPVSFRVNEWVGSAGGLDLSIEQETLSLLHGVKARFTPVVPGEPAVDVDAASATFRGADDSMSFEGGVTVVRQNDSLRAASVVARIQRQLRRLTSLEGLGGVEAILKDNSLGGTGPGSPTRVTADRFFCEIGQAGEIVAVHIVGEPNRARAEMAGPPRRVVTAPHFRIHVPGGRLNELRADNHVAMEEDSKPRKSVTAYSVNVYFDPATRRASSSVLEGGVTYKDGTVTAVADRATYELTQQRLLLTSVPEVSPLVRTPTETLRANAIEVLGQELVRANGNVYVEMKPRSAGGTTASESALFPEKSPVFLNADLGIFKKSEKSAVFTGNVRAWQGTNTLFARELQVTNSGETMFATGGVRAVLTNTRASAPKGVPLLASGNTMTARRAERRVDLEGEVRIIEEGRVLQTSKATLFLDAKQKLERVETTGNVVVTEAATKRSGTADRAVYRVQQRSIVLHGTPAEISDPRGKVRGNQVLIELDKNRVSVISGSTPTEATYNPQ